MIFSTLWVLRRDEPLVHVSVDISLITEHILDHDIIKGLRSVAIYCFQLSYIIRPDRIVIQPRIKKLIFFIDI